MKNEHHFEILCKTIFLTVFSIILFGGIFLCQYSDNEVNKEKIEVLNQLSKNSNLSEKDFELIIKELQKIK